MSLFSTVELAPRDPILGLSEQFNADPNPAKVNLGVGVYYDEDGKLPLLACVAAAERQMASGSCSGRTARLCGPGAWRRCRRSAARAA
jgi:aspartate/tyrosine/aromatic aminotransferase